MQRSIPLQAVLQLHSNKKKASRPKPTAVEVFALPCFQNKVPRGAERKN